MHNHIFYFKCFLQEAEEMHLKSVRIEGFHSEYSHMRRIFNTWQQNTYPSIMPVSEFHMKDRLASVASRTNTKYLHTRKPSCKCNIIACTKIEKISHVQKSLILLRKMHNQLPEFLHYKNHNYTFTVRLSWIMVVLCTSNSSQWSPNCTTCKIDNFEWKLV